MTATLTKTLGSLDDFRGTLCVPGDPDYPRVRAIWNGQVAREPALIATCHDACDVRTVLRRAVDAGMVTAVRGGGHNVAGTALCDGGVVIERGRDCQPAAPAVGQHAFAHEQHFSVSCATRVATFAIDWLQTRVVRTGQAVHAHRQPAAVGGEMEEWSVRQPLMKMVSSSAARTSRPLRRNSSASDTPSGCQPLAAR